MSGMDPQNCKVPSSRWHKSMTFPSQEALWEWERGTRGLLVAGKSVQPFPHGFENKFSVHVLSPIALWAKAGLYSQVPGP